MVDVIEQKLRSWLRKFGFWFREWLFGIPFDSVQVHQQVIEDICELAKSAAPKEMIAFLTGEIHKVGKNRILFVDGLYIKGYYASTNHTYFTIHDLPLSGVFGTVHSHPSKNNHPSGADRRLFSRFGWFHMIIGAPYTTEAIAVYNKNGDRLPSRL